MKMFVKFFIVLAFMTMMSNLQASAFIFADGNNPNRITHPTGYDGTGGVLEVSVCIDPSSESQQEMRISVENSIFVWNQLEPVSPNVLLGQENDIPSGTVDFESTVLHEIGHCIGLAHPNAATESGLSGDNRNYTKVAEGPNTVFDLDSGVDGIIGSADDLRGDDINLHWFELGSNNPFVLGDVVDSTTYTREVSQLPLGDNFVANADRDVGVALGFSQSNSIVSEAVMQQGAFGDEDQRQLGVSDVAGIRLGMSGLDRIEGTADDYRIRLVFGGVASGCDISVEVSGSSFAFCQVNGSAIGGDFDQVEITSARAVMGSASQFNWFFNQESILPEEIFSDSFEELKLTP